MQIKRSFASETELKGTLDFIFSKSKEGRSFNGILEVAFNPITIVTAVHNIKSNKGANTPGIDGDRIDKYLQMGRKELISLVQKAVKYYRPKPVRRIFIKKSNGKLRPLGIPSVLDKIIQECIRIIIEPICEAKFYPESFGFRPYRATNHAMKKATTVLNTRTAQKPVIAIEGDIEAFFDNINHRILLRKLYRIGICDKRILCIIKQMLKAGYFYQQELFITELGTIQGGIISPLLANVYLNDADWIIGRMYHHPKTDRKEYGVRQKLKSGGTKPKYLIRYCDDWIILTPELDEAQKLLRYLKKYYKHCLKLNLSKEKTLITNLTEKRAKFLGYSLEVSPTRGSPGKVSKGLVGKFYPDKEKVTAKTDKICNEILKLKWMKDTQPMAAKIENINAIITGAAEYYKYAICSNTYKYMDHRIMQTAYRTFRKLYGQNYREHLVPLSQLNNRPQRHKGRMDKTFAVNHEGLWVGITKMYITHSQRDRYNFNQKMTPYTEEGRKLYQFGEDKKKRLPLSRPPIYDEAILYHCDDSSLNNFEYYMNREYAYNRDKGRCKICGENLMDNSRQCHRINPALTLEKVNKVSNLVWICFKCSDIVHAGMIPEGTKAKVKSKFLTYIKKLKS